MRILDNYINYSIIKIFASTVSVFTFLYILIDVTANLDEILGHKVPLGILLEYYTSFFPVILVQTSSMACLIATLLTYSTLNNNNEIIVMRSSGLNFWQIAKPALFFGLIISALVFWLNERYVPMAAQSAEQIRNQNMILEVDRAKKNKANIENLTFYGLRNRLYYAESFNPNTFELKGITIVEYDQEQNVKEKVVALKGVWTGIAWKFLNCQISSFEKGNSTSSVKVKVYDEKLMDIQETPDDFVRQKLNVESMNIRNLIDYIGRFSESGATKALNNLRVDLFQKIFYPIGNFVIVFVGLPFALMLKNRKGMTFTSLGIAVFIGFLYYVVNALCLAFGKGGLFPPVVAAALTPVVFTAIALILIETYF